MKYLNNITSDIKKFFKKKSKNQDNYFCMYLVVENIVNPTRIIYKKLLNTDDNSSSLKYFRNC